MMSVVPPFRGPCENHAAVAGYGQEAYHGLPERERHLSRGRLGRECLQRPLPGAEVGQGTVGQKAVALPPVPNDAWQTGK